MFWPGDLAKFLAALYHLTDGLATDLNHGWYLVSASGTNLLDRLMNLAPVRRVREVVFAATNRLHLTWLAGVRAHRAQLRTLIGLVRRAQHTRFGREHDFARIRNDDDFRRLVPLRTPAMLTRLDTALDVDALAGCHRRALRTALALLFQSSPRTPLLSGRVACPAPELLPWLVRSSCQNDGFTSCLVEPGTVSNRRMRLGLLTRPEAPIAVEDPREGGWRLLVDHGCYFEFVPPGGEQVRLTLNDVSLGDVYELAVTSPGGWWACRSGLHVAFDRLTPPILRVVQAPVSAPVGHAPMVHKAPSVLTGLPESQVQSLWSVPMDR